MKIRILFCLIVFPALLNAQVNKTIFHNGLTRKYREYVPSGYTGATAVPLVIGLHGLGDNMINFSGVGFQYIADTAGFITVYPEAQTSPYGTAWNSGASLFGNVLNGTVDDISFISSLIDTLALEYNIDLSRVYVTGFSMGAFMCHKLACQLGGRIAAIASVSGTIGASLICNPTRHMPVFHMHGTADQTVAYIGNFYGCDAEILVDYWVDNNGCDTTPVFTALPNPANDSLSVEKYFYSSPGNDADVQFYKVIGGEHQWLFPPTNDLSYTADIWEFLRQYHNDTWGIDDHRTSFPNVQIQPNPADDRFSIVLDEGWDKEYKVSVFSSDGRMINCQHSAGVNMVINCSSYASGFYYILVTDRQRKFSAPLIIAR